MVQVVKLLQR